MVNNALLALLARRPMHGYELKEEFETEIGRHWVLNFGQIYTTLERLERDELVFHTTSTDSGGPDRKIYTLTAKGHDALNQWFSTPAPSDHRLKNQLYIKLIMSLTTGSVGPEEVLRIQRQKLFEELHDLTALKSEADQLVELSWILLLDSAILHVEADIRWLDMCAARLEKIHQLKMESLNAKSYQLEVPQEKQASIKYKELTRTTSKPVNHDRSGKQPLKGKEGK